jgi:dTDP-4-dehydrorhamnose reductase
VYFVFASSEFVFDGNQGRYRETDVAKPILLYGKQKKSVEDFIIENELFGCVLRLPKVYWAADGGATLFTKAIAEVTLGGGVMRVASDQVMTPLFGGDLFDILQILTAKRITGVLHCGGPLELSRFDLYTDIKKFFLARGMNVKVQLEECSIHEFKSSERRPENTSLNSGKLFEILERTTRSHLEILEALYGND